MAEAYGTPHELSGTATSREGRCGEFTAQSPTAATHVDQQRPGCPPPCPPRYRQASASENTLLGMLRRPSTADGTNGGVSGPAAAGAGRSGDTSKRERKASLAAAPPAPVLLSRSHTSIELLPLLFAPPPHDRRRAVGRAAEGADGGCVVGTAISASNATSTTAEAAPRTERGRPAIGKRKPRIAKVGHGTA